MKSGIPVFLSLASAAFATPSGLNNIPTADVIPHRTTAIQVFDTFGDGPHDLWAGFKTGWAFDAVKFEFGLDGHVAPDPSGPLFFQTKVSTNLWENGAFAVGVANIGLSDSDRNGDTFRYGVLTHDFKVFRVSAGYGWQDDNNTILFGIDRTFKVGGRNLNLNADLIQTRDEDGWLASVGAKYDLSKHVVLEGWVNLPDEGDTTFVAKINFVFEY